MNAVAGKQVSALERAQASLKPENKRGIVNVFWENLPITARAVIMKRVDRIGGDSDTAIVAMLIAYGDIHYPGAEPEDVALDVGTEISMDVLRVEDFLAPFDQALHG